MVQILVHYYHVQEIAFVVHYHTCPCPVGIQKGQEMALGVSLHLRFCTVLLDSEFTLWRQG